MNTRSSASPRKQRNAAGLEEWERQRREDPVEQALRAADLLLQSSGFGLVAIDLAGVPSKTARRIPLTTWFRFRRAVENTSAALLVIGSQACAQSCASLSLRLGSSRQDLLSAQTPVLSAQFSVLSRPTSKNDRDARVEERPTHAELLSGMEICAEVMHSRAERKPARSAHAAFQTRAVWTG